MTFDPIHEQASDARRPTLADAPEHVQIRVQQILDRAARRLLAEEIAAKRVDIEDA